MLSKSFFIVLLGCVSALAIPTQGNQNQAPEDIGSWLQSVHDGIKKDFKQTIKPYVKVYNVLVKENSRIQEYSERKEGDNLEKNFRKIIDQSRENLSDLENKALVNAIVNLQSKGNKYSSMEFKHGIAKELGLGMLNQKSNIQENLAKWHRQADYFVARNIGANYVPGSTGDMSSSDEDSSENTKEETKYVKIDNWIWA